MIVPVWLPNKNPNDAVEKVSPSSFIFSIMVELAVLLITFCQI